MRRTYREPNRKGPKFRKKTKTALDRDFVKRINKKYPDLCLSRRDIRTILNTFHALAIEIIAETRDGFEFHEQLGNIVLGKFRTQDFYSPNPKPSYQYNTPIDFTNWEENEWVCKVFYSNFESKYRFRNAELWAFQAGRPMKKAVSKAFRKNPHKYIYADQYGRINKIFRLAKERLNEKFKEERNKENNI